MNKKHLPNYPVNRFLRGSPPHETKVPLIRIPESPPGDLVACTLDPDKPSRETGLVPKQTARETLALLETLHAID